MALSDRFLQNTPTSLPGNLNKAELFALARAKNKKEQEDLSDPMLRNAIPLMSTAKGQFGGSPHGEGPFWRQYNQGGIVSLRRLTRPLGI